MFEQKRLCGHGAYATGAEQLRECDQQVDGEEEEVAHGANGTHHYQPVQDCTPRADCVTLRIRPPHEAAAHACARLDAGEGGAHLSERPALWRSTTGSQRA